ncbi:MAG: SpoIIE family protein phosphatase [Crocinitomicaceae bacterium]
MKFWLIFSALLIAHSLFAQNDYPYGQFNIRIIDHSENESGVQNWDIIQNNDQLIYVANNSGILEFNGNQWSIFKMENQEHPRSFAKNNKGEIYVGGQGEFGVIRYNEKGEAYSKKLSADVDSIDFKDIWKVHCIEEKTYFISRSHIFILDSNGIEVLHPPSEESLTRSYQVGNLILCSSKRTDTHISYVLRGNKFFDIIQSEGIQTTGIVQDGEETFVIDQNGKFYRFLSSGNRFKLEPTNRKFDFKEKYKIKSVQQNDKVVVIGTTGNGAKMFDLKGQFIRSIGETKGLNNSITHTSIFDQYNNLWLCNDNGLAFVEMSSPITAFYQEEGVTSGIIEDLLVEDDEIYLATHSDIFRSVKKKDRLVFEQSPVFKMETWQIKSFTFTDGKKYNLVIANDGIYALSDQMERTVVQKPIFAWDMHQSTTNPNRIYVGLDGGGVGSLLYEKGKFTYEGHYSNTSGDVRAILEYDNQVYYTVKYEGVHKLDTNKTQKENQLQGLTGFRDSSLIYEQFTIEQFEGKVYVGTSHGLFEMENDKLKKSEIINGHFIEEKLLIHRLINDGEGKLWIVMFHKSGSENERAEIGYLNTENGELVWNSSKFNSIKNDVIFCLEKGNNGIYWLGGVKGLYTYNESIATNFDRPFQVDISSVHLNEDRNWIHHTKYAEQKKHTISYEQNTIRFEFGSNAYLGGLTNEFSYYLEGEEDNWSKWKTVNTSEYQRLAEGDYVFHVKAKNFYGYESEQATFSFTILPPWYRTWWAYLIYFLAFILLVTVIIKLSIRRVKAQNERLEEIVKERTAEIAQQNTKLEFQKAEIEQKTTDILDSIKYAERIQTAILPTDETLDEIFDGEHFVLYKPKDIVSGDFYWADRFGSEAIFAAVDCTGHGVPGAFVSIVGFNGLNRTVNEFKLRKPGEILDKLTDLVVETFEKSESQIKDGMDIALCNINYETNMLTYSGANNPLVVIRNKEIIEIKANKQPIGEFERREPFITHEFKLEKGDCVYIFSDGYADQFGGDKGKKFKGKALKNLLVDISTFEMNIQLEKLNTTFHEWKGNFEQLDDVCLFGVKI